MEKLSKLHVSIAAQLSRFHVVDSTPRSVEVQYLAPFDVESKHTYDELGFMVLSADEAAEIDSLDDLSSFLQHQGV